MEDNETLKPMSGISRTTTYFSIGWILVTGLLVSFLIYRSTREFLSQDALPELLPIVPQTLEQMGHPAIAKVGLYVKDFTEFNMLKNEFEFSGILWFLFDPSIISLKTLGKFSFEKGKILSVSEPTTRLVKGKLFARYDIRVSFKTNPTFVNFPFDSHSLYIIMDNNSVTPGEIAFQSSYNEFALSPEIAITGWDVYATRVYSGYSVARLEKLNRESDVAHPRVIFAIEYVHSGVRHAMLIILPLLLIFFMSMFTFSIDSSYYKSITSISSGTVTAMLAYRFVIERLSPPVGYFMQTDYIFFLFLIAVCITFFINVGLSDIRQKYSKIIVTLLHLMVILAFIFLLRG